MHGNVGMGTMETCNDGGEKSIHLLMEVFFFFSFSREFEIYHSFTFRNWKFTICFEENQKNDKNGGKTKHFLS